MSEQEPAAGPNAGQAAFWNAQGGQTWVELQASSTPGCGR